MSDHNLFSKEILANHVAVLGKTGSGKTSTLKLLVEQVATDGARVCVLDPIKSDWWGLTSSASGKRAGLPFYILGGPRGHVPLHSSAGSAIGELVADGTMPLSIIDMADFEPGGLQRFFVEFAPALLRKMRGVVHLVIEEAQEFAPKELAGIGRESLGIHWAKKLAVAGRSKGIRLAVGTHRVQSLHNALLGSCETVIVHRITLPADQEPVVKWLRTNVADKERRAEIEGSMSSLPTGTAWMCSGEAEVFQRVKFPRIKTFDNSATPTADTPSQDKIVTNQVPIDRLREIIGDAVKQAEDNDPKALRKRVAELTAENKRLEDAKTRLVADRAATPQAAPTAPVIDKAAVMKSVQDGFTRSARTLLEPLQQAARFAAEQWATKLSAGFDGILRAMLAAEGNVTKTDVAKHLMPNHRPLGASPAAVARPAKYPQTQELPPARVVNPLAIAPDGTDRVTPTTRNILDQIHRAHPVALTFEAAALRAGVSRRSSAYERYRKEVMSSIEVQPREDGRLQSGPGYAQDVEPGADPVASFANRLPPSYARMLNAIASAGFPMKLGEVAAAANVSTTSSGLTRGLKELEALGLIVIERVDGEPSHSLHPDIKAMRE